jgi:hypothetical protein
LPAGLFLRRISLEESMRIPQAVPPAETLSHRKEELKAQLAGLSPFKDAMVDEGAPAAA